MALRNSRGHSTTLRLRYVIYTNSLGLEFLCTINNIVLHQKMYIDNVLNRFHIENCNATAISKETSLKLTARKKTQLMSSCLSKLWGA